MSAVEFSFNWFYADDRDIAFFSSGRLPLRAPGTDPAAPDSGHGRIRLARVPALAGHAQAVNPPSGLILNWNNKPAADVGSADSNFAYGSVHRVELLRPALAARRKHTLAGVTGAMNAAATQDLRTTDVWPAIRAVLRTGNAPSARAEAAVGLVDAWRGAGSNRLDRDLDGKIDDPGAAVLDAAWPRLADAVMSPVLGPLVDRLARLMGRSHDPGAGGSAYISGWYGYVDKDLRSLLDQPVEAPYSRRYCGAGGPRHLPRRALGSNRRRSRRAREDAGPGAVRLARRRDCASASVSPPACCRTRCAGRTARPSSRSCRSPGHRPR